METNTVIREKLSGIARAWDERSPRRVYIDIAPGDLTRAASILFGEMRLRFIIASGVDTPDAIEVLYHFGDDPSGVVYTLRVTLRDKAHPAVDSLTPVIKGASWIEREIRELLGVEFRGHPRPARLLLPDDWPDGNYPLRHDHER